MKKQLQLVLAVLALAAAAGILYAVPAQAAPKITTEVWKNI